MKIEGKNLRHRKGKEKSLDGNLLGKSLRLKHTTPTILSGSERPGIIIQKHGHIASEKSELKSIKAGADDAKVPNFFFNEIWRTSREGRGQPTPHKREYALDRSR